MVLGLECSSFLRVSLVTLTAWFWPCFAWASPPSEQTLTCVSASTQGQVERDRGHLLEARAQFRACAQPACPSIVRSSCSDWLSELEPRIPSVVVRVNDAQQGAIAEASVRIDGASVVLDGRPVQLDPGAHDLVAEAAGWLTAQRTALLVEREQARLVVIELQRPKAPEPAAPISITAPTMAPPAAAADPHAEAAPREAAPFRVPVGSWVLGGLGVAGIV
ncbi:MAG TPA: hypothetical protein VFZ61_33510, partial [Polyangiales bacterium]